jgi:polysaccharide export outer membrane protein
VSLLAILTLALLQAARPAPTPARSPAPATPVPTPAAAAGTSADEYRVGPGDVLDVVVFGNDDLSRAAPIQTDGTVNLPLLGEVPVSGLTAPEVQRKVTTLLARDYLVKPQVEVRVREYQSQAVTVLGEVNSPGRKVLKGRTRLIDVLVESGGFTPRASGEVSVSRSDGTFNGGETTLTLRFGGALDPVQRVNLEVPLRNGDIVTATPKAYVTVEGEVNRPGRYTIDGDLTVTGAVTLAGGLTRFGSNDLKVRRVDPQSGKVQILDVDLKAVRKGKVPDLKLLANDVVSVSRRLF